MLYGLAVVTGTGMLRTRAYSISSARVMPQMRAGAMTVIVASSARADTSRRTWSLSFPVQPCAITVAPSIRATSTRCLAMSGRPSAVASGYRSS